MANPTIYEPDAGAIFSISGDNWTLISQRVGIVQLAASIEDAMTQMIPAFPDLLRVSVLWYNTTFPGLGTSAAKVSALAKSNVDNLKAVQALIPDSVDQPILAEVQSQIQARFTAMSAATAPVASGAVSLNAQLHDFADVNAAADAQAQQRIDMLGPGWASLSGPLNMLQAAIGATEGSWSALNDDLAGLAGGRIEITTSLLTSLAIDSAISGWTNVGTEADAFHSAVPGQLQEMQKPLIESLPTGGPAVAAGPIAGPAQGERNDPI